MLYFHCCKYFVYSFLISTFCTPFVYDCECSYFVSVSNSIMPQTNSCKLAHPQDDKVGPCSLCKVTDIQGRYVHLCQRNDMVVRGFIIASHSISLSDCICRKCYMSLSRKATKMMQIVSPLSSSVTSNYESTSESANKHISDQDTHDMVCTNHNIDLQFQTDRTCTYRTVEDHVSREDMHMVTELGDAHAVFLQPEPVPLVNSTLTCTEQLCIVCERKLGFKTKAMDLQTNKHKAKFKTYCQSILKFDPPDLSSASFLCLRCYKLFSKYCLSQDEGQNEADSYSAINSVLDSLKQEQTETAYDKSQTVINETIKKLCSILLKNEAIFLPDLYSHYQFSLSRCNLQSDQEQNNHDIEWLLRIMRQALGSAFTVYTPPNKRKGRLLYRKGADPVSVLHSTLHAKNKKITDLENDNQSLHSQCDVLISDQVNDLKAISALNNASKILKDKIYHYTKSQNEGIPDLSDFNAVEEVKKIHPFLWNFVSLLSASEQEEKSMNRQLFDWNSHQIDKSKPERVMQKLFITSCIFHSSSSRCFQPLHLLMTDIADRFSNSSSTFLSLNARLGAGVSKDTLQRYIVQKSVSLSKKNEIALSGKFTVASFDNIDKNHKYATVSASKERCGFHGTTVQAVEPLPLSCNLPGAAQTSSEVTLGDTCALLKETSRSRTLPKSVLESFNPENKVGLPPDVRSNRFSAMHADEVMLTSESEKDAITLLSNKCFVFSTSKHILSQGKVSFPGLKTFLSNESCTNNTEKSNFHYIAILDDAADCKDTVIKVLNILHDKFQVGTRVQHVVVVGDGKSYDLLIKIKNEYGHQLDWVLPFPGDWHILKNLQSVLFKIYFDAGLKELASMHHHGATFKSLGECTNFSLTHKFIVQVWEAIYRHQVSMFLKGSTDIMSAEVYKIFSDVCMEVSNEACDTDCLMSLSGAHEQIKAVKVSFDVWREGMCERNETFKFWDNFIHVDVFSYLTLYFGIRSRDWKLRNASLKQISCLFYAFDRLNYSRMIPYHLADLQTFPADVLGYLASGGFAASVSGQNWYSIAMDEAHEMEINLQVKSVLNSVSQEALATLTHYLPYRAKTLQNFKNELNMLKEDTDPHHRELTKNYITGSEVTVLTYIDQLSSSTLFSEETGEFLQHIFHRNIASEEQRESLMNYHKYGVEDLENYLKCVLLRVSDLSSKLPSRKKRNLKTFSESRRTVTQQSREIKDNRTVISCLRKKIAYSKVTGQPINCLEQFLKLPMAITDSNGTPYKGQKSHISQCFQSLYGDAFLSSVSKTDTLTCIILEGMFMINSSPQGQNKTFADYASFLFDRWVMKNVHLYDAYEVHVVFDDHHRHGVGPKDVERERRDKKVMNSSVTENGMNTNISAGTTLPVNWNKFITCRENKKALISFLSYAFLELATEKCSCTFVTAGGFTDENRDKALCCIDGIMGEYVMASCNHEEADTRVWVHATATTSSRIIIYSPDTDTYFVGLPLMPSFAEKSIYVQLKDTPYGKTFINMTCLANLVRHDLLLQDIHEKEKCLQMLYIMSGCDYVSYFRGLGKKTFLEAFRNNSSFISGEEYQLTSFDNSNGLLSFYRLVAAVYFRKHAAAFHPHQTVKSFFQSINETCTLQTSFEKHVHLINTIREYLWDRVLSEDEMMPNPDALRLHWLRCCWVSQVYSQASLNVISVPKPEDWGWTVEGSSIKVVWDTDENFRSVEKKVDWFRKGCSCKTGCKTKRCKCKNGSSYCGPGCKCLNCVNISIQDDMCVETEDDLSSNMLVLEESFEEMQLDDQ